MNMLPVANTTEKVETTHIKDRVLLLCSLHYDSLNVTVSGVLARGDRFRSPLRRRRSYRDPPQSKSYFSDFLMCTINGVT